MDDLEAVRAALGYRQLDVIGSSYGAPAAQVYLKLHPSSVRTVILTGGTAIDVPYFDRYAVNAQRALDQLATLCASGATRARTRCACSASSRALRSWRPSSSRSPRTARR